MSFLVGVVMSFLAGVIIGWVVKGYVTDLMRRLGGHDTRITRHRMPPEPKRRKTDPVFCGECGSAWWGIAAPPT